MTAHILKPYTNSRLGASNNPAFVPNHFVRSGSRPNLWNRIKSLIVNIFFNAYYRSYIQSTDYEIVKKVYPDTPDLEVIGSNISLILLNQFFPLTGARLYGPNVIEVGGMHIKKDYKLADEELKNFLNTSDTVVYISFGSVAKNLPRKVLDNILKFIQKSNLKFVWKVDDVHMLNVSDNILLRKWVSQTAILCNPNVKAFISHSGMLSSAEAMFCGVPIVSMPMFGDQFANAEAAREVGLGVPVDLVTLDELALKEALDTVLLKRYQDRAKQLSELWRDRPLSPMDTAVYWIEYIAKHKGVADLRPPTVDLPLYQYLLLDVFLIFMITGVILFFFFWKMFEYFRRWRNKINVAGKKVD